MLATGNCRLASYDGYGFEFKWDGYRALLFSQARELRVLSRNRQDLIEQFPELARLANELPPHSLVLDGELTVLSPRGIPSFGLLQRYRKRQLDEAAANAQTTPGVLTYLAFDLLFIDGSLTLDLPYVERRALLEALEIRGPTVQVPPYYEDDLEVALDAAKRLGLEGLVAKRLTSPYRPGRRSTDWCKLKLIGRQEFVVGGWIPRRDGRIDLPGSLLLGYFEATGGEPTLRFAGNVGSGFSEADLRDLGAKLQMLRVEHSPFGEDVDRPGAIFVRPELVVEVEFSEWTHDGLVRQAVFKGERIDRNPQDVVKEPLTSRLKAQARR